MHLCLNTKQELTSFTQLLQWRLWFRCFRLYYFYNIRTLSVSLTKILSVWKVLKTIASAAVFAPWFIETAENDRIAPQQRRGSGHGGRGLRSARWKRKRTSANVNSQGVNSHKVVQHQRASSAFIFCSLWSENFFRAWMSTFTYWVTCSNGVIISDEFHSPKSVFPEHWYFLFFFFK